MSDFQISIDARKIKWQREQRYLYLPNISWFEASYQYGQHS